MGSEDVGLFTLDGKIPGAMYWLGAADPEKLAESKKSRCAAAEPALCLVCSGIRASDRDGRHLHVGNGARPVEMITGAAGCELTSTDRRGPGRRPRECGTAAFRCPGS